MAQIFENLYIFLGNEQQVIIGDGIKIGHTFILQSVKYITFIIGTKNPKRLAGIQLIGHIALHERVVLFGNIIIKAAF